MIAGTAFAAVARGGRGGGCRGGGVAAECGGWVRGRAVGAAVCPAYEVGGRGGGRDATAKLVAMLPVQPVQSVERVQDLLLGHAGATQPLQQIYLLDGEARLLA